MKKLGIISSKGGTGKTTIAVNLARAFRNRGYRVGIFDCDFTAPNVSILLNASHQKPKFSQNRAVLPIEVEGMKFLGWDSIWKDGVAVQVEDRQVDEDDLRMVVNLIKSKRYEGAIKYLGKLIADPSGAIYYVKQLFEEGAIEWGDTDWLIIDTSPTTSGTVRAVMDVDLEGVLVVTQPSSLSLADNLRTIDLLRKKAKPIYGLVSNMKDQFDKSEDEVKLFAENCSIPFLGSIPLNPNAILSFCEQICDYIARSKPVKLKIPEIEREEWEETVRKMDKVSRLIDLLGEK